MLSVPLVYADAYLFHAEHICHLYSLLAPIKTIVNTILSGRTTHITIFLTIAVAQINLPNAFRFQKWLRILPPNFFLQ